MPHSIQNLKIVRESVIESFYAKGICLCKFISSPAKNDRKRMINTAFASWHIQLKNRVSDFWHVHLFFCGTRIKSEEANHQHFLWKNADYSKTEKENKNRRHGFGGKLSGNKPAKFQLNRFRGCRLGVENVRLLKKVLFSTNPLAKLLSDSLLLNSLLLDSLLSDSSISQSHSKM